MPEAMDAVFRGETCRMVRSDGRESTVDTGLWTGAPSRSDGRLFLDPCGGSTIDVGCGPGRLAGALADRGIATLGTDISWAAVEQTRARGATAVHRDVFDPLPRTGRWRHVLLADGNIGIGGSPVRLLRRVRQLLYPTGTAIVELSPTDTSRVHEDVRLRVGDRVSHAFAWATVGTSAVPGLAAAAGLRVVSVDEVDGRTTATLGLV
ncbi:bifunctional 2-polyprenyl-6-hydroxyphenol methylase/3-demethylubiquinol 3-O-methyltransferase UbiG [Marmoricola sp. Leaf446]|uniref:class I SAM-dependent methyltransferase n=1 Tax=Marmoricola sp. Leaf446 TaxID=1736379 RepID=UPI001F38EEFE|nr:methyltransferase domain-containing protein [Marmoricola sp. Leaf446]